ncbi:hypothetical protein NFI96_018494 [Prochilodus magdalenae]|nr:hypothetical protein NFI96_018494 [Prochilodus magdalenae]
MHLCLPLVVDYGNSGLSLIQRKRSDSPAPSCVSMKSDASMGDPPAFKDSGPSSGHSLIQRKRSDSPAPSCVSMKSDASMDLHPAFKDSDPSSGHRTNNWSCVSTHVSPSHRYGHASDTLKVQKNFKLHLKKKFECLNEVINQETPTLLSDIYTELYITEGDSGEVNDEHEVRQIEAASRRTVTEDRPIQCSDIFKPLSDQDKPIRTVLTKGVAGIGKTVSVQKFILDWTEGKANQDVHFIFPLPFRELNLMEDQDLPLMDLLQFWFKEITETEISRSHKVLFIFDGLDESRLDLDFQSSVRLDDVTQSSSVNVLLTNLIKGNLLPSALIWITSRPAAADQIPSDCVDRVTEVRGFSDPQKEEYFRKRIRDQSLTNQIITHLKTSRSLYIMCHIPVFCWISATVLERLMGGAEGGEIPKTLTQMYTHFLLIQTKVIRGKYTQIQKTDEEILLKLGHLAFQQLMKGNLIFYEEDLRQCGIDVTEASVYSGVCTQIFREESGLYQSKVYCFVHLSVQEHLAALYVHLTFINQKINVLKQSQSSKRGSFKRKEISDVHKAAVDQALQSTNGHLDLFLRFLLGLSLESSQTLIQELVTQTGSSSITKEETVQYIKKKIRETPPAEKSINLFHCLNELGDYSLVEEVQLYLQSGNLSQRTLSHSQWSAVAFILLTSKKNLNKFVLQKYNRSDDVLLKLLPVVTEFRTADLSFCNLTKKSCAALASVLSSESSSLRKVFLSGNNFGDSGMMLLSAGLESPHCKLRTLSTSPVRHEGGNTLDHVYTNIKEAFSTTPLPPLGKSDHISLLMKPTYRQLLKRVRATVRTVRVWPEGAESVLQDCFQCTDWEMFRSAATTDSLVDINEYATSVTGFIRKCVDDVTQTKQIRTLPNQKPWMNSDVRSLLKARDAAFKSGNSEEVKVARHNLKAGIRAAKHQYSSQIAAHFNTNSDPRRMWQGIQVITDYKSKVSTPVTTDAALPAELNNFYARFETPAQAQSSNTALLPTTEEETPLILAADEVRTALMRVSTRKATGQDGIPGRVLKVCASQLASTITSMNDYRPIALTPIVMKCLERLILSHIKRSLPSTLDPHQFAYRANRSTDDAVSLAIHTALNHLDSTNSYVRMLFIDFSSAFNTIIPSRLIHKLSTLGISSPLCSWIMDFLTCRPQCVRMGEHTSPSLTLSTGCPQGIVLSPLLYTLYTHDCTTTHSSNTIIKFTDDTTIIGNITNVDEGPYREEVKLLTEWCAANNLSLNVSKTKELIIDFRKGGRTQTPLNIGGTLVERVSSFKFLGVHLAEDLIWTTNTAHLVRKAQQRLHFLRRLQRVNLPQQLLCNFYRSTVERILTSCITVWYGSATSAERKALQRVVKTAQHITASTLPPIQDIYNKRRLGRAVHISSDPTHPSHPLFQPLPSGKRLCRCNITDEGCAALTSTLKSNPSHLRELNLSDNTLGDLGVKLLSVGLKNPSCKLESLGLCNCNIRDEGCAALTSALKRNPSHLRILLLSDNNLGNAGVKLLSVELQKPLCKLETLSLCKCNFTYEGCAALTSALALNPSHLRDLNLSGNNLGDSGVKLLSAGLDNPLCKLKILGLCNCSFAYKGCAALTSALTSNPSHLQELILSENEVGDSGVKLLFTLMENPLSKLEILRLCKCKMTYESCPALTSALKSNPSHLRELHLSENNLGDSGVKMLSVGLHNPNCKLETLKLRDCNITDEGCAAIASALKSNPSHLRKLNLSLNKLGDLGVRLLSAVLEHPLCKLEILGLLQRKRSDSPEPSRVSMRSDASMGHPPGFKDGDPSSRHSLLQRKRSDSPENSHVSMKSDASMGHPPGFKDGDTSSRHSRIQTGTLSCVSMKSDASMGHPPGFIDGDPSSGQTQLRHGHATGAVNIQENWKLHLKKKFECLNEVINQESPTLLSEIYTELYITESDSGEVNDEHEVRQIEAASRRTVTEDRPIKCSDIFKPLSDQDKPIRTVLTKGVAGIGKTVSVQKFILDWTEGKANQDVHFIFPLPFRELNLMEDQDLSLMDLLQSWFKEITETEISRSHKVLLIFDGLDESRLTLDFRSSVRLDDVTQSSSVNVLLTNLIKGNLLPSALIWITSRPAAADQIPSDCVDRVTEVRGFSDPQKEEYFRKRIRDQSLTNQIITHLKTSRSLYIMCHIPVFCWISATVLERLMGGAEGGEIPKTLTQMYTHFLLIQTKVIRGKYTQIQKTDEEILLKLGHLAFQQLMKGNLIFYEEDLKLCGIDVTEASVYSGVCTQIFREESGLYQSKVYCFVHLSVQEHLAALYVHLTFINQKINVLKKSQSFKCRIFKRKPISLSDVHKPAVNQALQSKNGHLDLFLRFLLGLSLESSQTLIQELVTQTGSSSITKQQTVQYIKKKIRKNPSAEKSINLFHCLNELDDHSLVEEVQQYLQSGKLDHRTLSSSQWSAVVFVLLTSEENLDEFVLRRYNRSSDVLLKLLPVFADSKTADLSCCNLTKKSCAALASVLSSDSSSLSFLDLYNNDLGDSGVELLCAGLEHPHCKLETLRLWGCNITKDGCVTLTSALNSNPSHLRELILSENRLGDSGVKQLSAVLENPLFQLEILWLRNCNITDKGCAALTSALKSNPSHLRELFLSNNNLGDSGVKLLSAALENPLCKLEIL